MSCLLLLFAAGDAFALGHGQRSVPSGELNAMVRVPAAPRISPDAAREVASTTTLPESVLPVAAPAARVGPADPPAPPDPPPLPLRAARLARDFPDPVLLWADDRWYAFATNAEGRNVQVSSSPDLVAWTDPVDAAPSLPAYASAATTWAPTVARIESTYVLYVSLPVGAEQCIDRLTSSTPAGPYAPVPGGPMVCNQTGGTGAIDPSVTIVDGTPYLYWKAAGARAEQLFGAPLTPDGLSFAGLPRHLLAASARWQQAGVENPSMIAVGDQFWLLYSGAYWATSRYAMGFARCDTALGPCREQSTGGPWLASRDGAVGPGGGAATLGPDGAWRLAFHAWQGGTGYGAGGVRVLHVETIAVGPGGPEIVDRPPTGGLAKTIVGPSGVVISGLVVDPDVPSAVPVAVFVDGRQIADLRAAPAFEVRAAPADGDHRVCAVASDDLGQSYPQLGCEDFTIHAAPFGAVDGTTSTTVTGWAIAPSTTDAIGVDVYVDGTYVRTVRADIPRDDVAAAWPAYGAAHGFATTVPHGVACFYASADDNLPAPDLGCVMV